MIPLKEQYAKLAIYINFFQAPNIYPFTEEKNYDADKKVVTNY